MRRSNFEDETVIAVYRLTSLADASTTRSRIRRCRWLYMNLIANRHDPLMLQQFRRRRPLPRIPDKAFLEEINPTGAQLLRTRQLWRIALRDVVHDGPFIVETCPRPPASRHLEDDTAERPYVNGAGTAGSLAFDDFGGHVHGRAGHGFVAFGEGRGIGADERLALPGDHLGGAEVDVFDYAAMVEEDICNC